MDKDYVPLYDDFVSRTGDVKVTSQDTVFHLKVITWCHWGLQSLRLNFHSMYGATSFLGNEKIASALMRAWKPTDCYKPYVSVTGWAYTVKGHYKYLKLSGQL